ncbi:MAG: ATP-binding protein [Phycisphaerae bacterium]|jgi:hypothetical protein
MEPFNKPLREIKADDINVIIENKIPEDRGLDYKRELPPETPAGNKELLKDISAFANTVGGYLVYGIDEEKGVPIKVYGVKIEDFDKFKQRSENLLRTGVAPVIRGVDYHQVDVGGLKKVVIIKIPRSIARPHVVRIDNYFRFHGRNSSGVHQLEIEDLRRAFLESETLATKIRNFRNDRLSAISTNETFAPLVSGAKIVLHIIPDSSFEIGKKYNLGENCSSSFPPSYSIGGYNSRITFDGMMTYWPDLQGVYCYTHIFNNGILERVDANMLIGSDKKIIPPSYEEEMIALLNNYLGSFKRYQIELPAWICLSLIDIKGYVMGTEAIRWHKAVPSITQDELSILPIRIESYDLPVDEILKPAFDSVWNACGYEKCPGYGKDGKWQRYF